MLLSAQFIDLIIGLKKIISAAKIEWHVENWKVWKHTTNCTLRNRPRCLKFNYEEEKFSNLYKFIFCHIT